MTWQDYLDSARAHRHLQTPTAWVSCSSLPSLAACSQFRHRESTGEPQTVGTACHMILADDVPVPYDTPDEVREIILACRARLAEIVREYGISQDAEYRWERPVRHDGLRLMGTPDLVIIDDAQSLAVVIDWKTGRHAHVHRMIQLYGYAECLGLPREWLIACEIVAPVAGNDSYEHRPEALRQALQAGRARQCADCDWCASALDCSALCRETQALRSVRADDLPPNLGQILDACYAVGVREREAERVRNAIRQRILAGEQVEGWTLHRRNKRVIADPAGAFGLMTAAGMDADAVQSAARWSWADLYRIGEAAGLKKGEVDNLLNGVCRYEEQHVLARTEREATSMGAGEPALALPEAQS